MAVFNKGVIKIVSFCFIAAFIQASPPPANQVNSSRQERILSTRRQMECIEEIRVDPDLVVKVKNGEWKDDSELLKQWVLCVLMKAGLMTREGVYRLDVAMTKAPQEHQSHIEYIIDKCLSQKAIPAQMIAYNFAKCYNSWLHGNHTFASIF